MHQRGVNLGEAVFRLAWLEGMDNEKAVRRNFDATVMSTADIEDAYGVKPLAQFTCGVGDSREQLRQIQEPVS